MAKKNALMGCYDGKVTIITGGVNGIGEACVRMFFAAGSKVAFCDLKRNESLGVTLETELNSARSANAKFIVCDVSKPEDIINLIDTTAKYFGRIDCLINNAGIHPPHYVIDNFTLEDFKKVLDINLLSIFVASQRALPYLRKTQGNIINLASLVGTMGQLEATTYCATKGAVISFTKALAIDEARHDVRVNSISPGNIMTPMWQQAIDASPDSKKAKADGDAAQILGRMGTPVEAAKLCLFLAADATFTTGVDHILSGGAELAYGRKTQKAQSKL